MPRVDAGSPTWISHQAAICLVLYFCFRQEVHLVYPMRLKLQYDLFHSTVFNVQILLDFLAADTNCIYTVLKYYSILVFSSFLM